MRFAQTVEYLWNSSNSAVALAFAFALAFASGYGAVDVTAWRTGNTFVATGTGGTSGLGGYSIGNTGGAGAIGTAADTNIP